MRNRYGLRAVICLGMLVWLLCGLTAWAQNFDFAKDRAPMVALRGLWRFHTGDNPAWAKPGFDDSHWALLKGDEGWRQQEYKHYSGMAWYRFTVTLPAQHGPMALYLPVIHEAYQVFANGRLVGHEGTLPPDVHLVEYVPQVVALPVQLTQGAAKIHFAIRVWESPTAEKLSGVGGPGGTTWIGSAEAIRNWQYLQTKQVFWSNADGLIECLAYLVVGLGTLGLFFLGPGEDEYLWFGLSQIASAAQLTGPLASLYYAIPVPVGTAMTAVPELATLTFQLLFVYAFLQRRFDRTFWIGICLIVLGTVPQVATAGLANMSSVWLGAYLAVALSGLAGYNVVFLLVLYGSARRANRDALLLLVAYGITFMVEVVAFALLMGAVLGAPQALPALNALTKVAANWPFPFNIGDFTTCLVEFALLGILIGRFARTRRDEQRLAGELEAARSVQQVLVPEVIPQAPGYEIGAAYRPAQEVGGDFFQIVRQKDGGLLAVIGDVSGKGVGAGMTVSLLVGTFRALAEYERSPAALLRGMNERMVGRTGGGFTTCMILRATADGRVVMANAGHLHPYVDGEEVEVLGGLPLGLAAEVDYSETTLELAEGSRLTLLTDGVVEARDVKTREILGFERTRELVGHGAEAIAMAAQRFGQEDDITVLTLVRQAEAKTTAAEAVDPVLSPA